MFKNNFIVFILIISLNYCFSEEYVSKKQLVHKIDQIKNHFERLFDQISNEFVKVKEQNWNNLNTCGDEWISYSDRKCFRVLGYKGSMDEANRKCKEIDSTLISIQSEQEQLFLSENLEKYNNISDYVWIGLEISDPFVNSYDWMDGNDLKYENWDENSDKEEECVEMSLGKASLGKWRDESCSKKYLIVCQKKQNTKTVFSEDLKNLTKVIERQNKQIITQEIKFKTEINQLNIELTRQNNQINTLIPIGFLYTQFPHQSSPQQLWSNMVWQDVTGEYSGLFFIEEGGDSETFGKIQQANQSWISNVFLADCYYREWHHDGLLCDYTHTPLIPKNWMDIVPYGSWYRFTNSLNFYTTGGEVRPKNTAIRIFR